MMKVELKPKVFVSHDNGGLFLWVARKRPKLNRESGMFECPDAVRLRLPYSWYGHMMREGACAEIDIEAAVVDLVGRKTYKPRNPL